MNSSSQLKWRRHQLWSNATIKTKTTESMSDTRIKEEKKNPATTDRSSKSVSNDECWRQPRSSRTATSYAHIQRTMKKFRTRLMKTEKENGERKQNKETHQRNESSQRASEIERESEQTMSKSVSWRRQTKQHYASKLIQMARTDEECEQRTRKRGLIKLLCQLNFIFILIVLVVRLLFVSEWVGEASERARLQAIE